MRTSRSRTQNRSIRNLEYLRASGSTSRALNLIDVFTRHGEEPEYREQPFFQNPILNRCIIVKHRLRTNELEEFETDRTGATKVILPIDITDLKFGARSFFIGQIGYQNLLDELVGGRGRSESRDFSLLKLIDQLPSLDPFLMRERLRKNGFEPARCYFDFSEADMAQMFTFVRREISALIGLSFDDNLNGPDDRTAKFAQKILANASDIELEPFRLGMGMDRPSFDEGMFCWKGFIYYKWTLFDLFPQVRPIIEEIGAIKPTGAIGEDERTFIQGSKARLAKSISVACETVRLTLKLYDDAYADLTRNGQPQAFREFLLRAPQLFYELGERLAAVQHVVSFWRYRFSLTGVRAIAADELVDLLSDFEFSLNFNRSREAA